MPLTSLSLSLFILFLPIISVYRYKLLQNLFTDLMLSPNQRTPMSSTISDLLHLVLLLIPCVIKSDKMRPTICISTNLFCLVILFDLIILSALGHESGEFQISPRKSSHDSRSYRFLSLPNSLHCLLISDNSTFKV